MSLYDLIRISKRVYIIGNGGSYANSIHIANDLLSVGIKAYSMDPATLTAFSNDYGYEEAFAKWLKVVAEPWDLLIALSGSGKSPNILKAIAVAEGIGMSIWKEFGAVQGLKMQESEEKQLQMGHELMLRFKNAGTS